MTEYQPDTGYFEYGSLTVVSFLKSKLPPNVVVATQVPSPKPGRFVVVRSVPSGGVSNLVLSRRRFTISCYDSSEIRASRLAEMVRGYLFDGMYCRGSGFRDVTVIGEPAYYPDPTDLSTPRSQLTVDLLVRKRFSAWDGS